MRLDIIQMVNERYFKQILRASRLYPKTLQLIRNWYEDKYADWNLRDLYDFFDKHNLNAVIIPEYYKDGIAWNWQILWLEEDVHEVSIYYNGTMMYGDNGEYLTRVEAEEAMFMEAFKMLEDRL